MVSTRLPSPSMAVALLALVLAAGGVAVASIPGPDGSIKACVADGGRIGIGSELSPYAVPKGTLRVVDSGASCGSGETPLTIGAPENPVTEDPPLVFAARTATSKRLRDRRSAVTSNAVAAGQYLVVGAVRVSHPGGIVRDQRVKCAVLANGDKVVPGSTVFVTFERGADGGDVTIPISTVIENATAGLVKVACEEDPVPGGDGVVGSSARAAAAEGVAKNSPGVVSGSLVQVPVHVPVNVCGNTINVVGLLNAAQGNVCVNE